MPDWWKYFLNKYPIQYPTQNPIKLQNNPNIFNYNGKNYDVTKYKMNGGTYDISGFKDKMFELYLNEVDPYEYGDYDDNYAGFDPISYYLQSKEQELNDAYNQSVLSIIGTNSISPTALPPLKLSNKITRQQAEQAATKNAVLNETEVPNKLSTNNYNKFSAIADTAANIGAMFSRGQTTYNGPKGAIRAGIDQGWNSVADTAAKFGPYGQMVSLGMKGLNAINNIQGAIFGATNGMTSIDSVFDSPIGALTGLGWINQAFGKKSDTIRKNDETFAQLGSDYSGTNAGVDDSLRFSGKKYGTFSSSARKDANALISEMKRQLNSATDVADIGTTRFNLVGGMSAIAGNRRAFDMQGGYNLGAIHIGREGMKIESVSELQFPTFTVSELVPEFRNGGPLEEDYSWIIDYAKSKDLNWIKRWLDPNRATIPDWKVDGQVATHKLSYGEADGKFFVYPEVLEIDGLLFDFTDPKNGKTRKDAVDRAFETKEVLFFDNEDAAKWFTEHYKEYAPFKYKEGGKVNVIPEGALHARLHHMENAEDLTKKGIPVVSEGEDGKLELHAEIEREELILRLEVTLKLEELAKDSSDEAATEAGKLLVKEILYNTIDNTNNLL